MRVASPRWLPGLPSGPLPRGAGVFRASRRRGLPGMGAGGSLGAREEGSRSAREGARGGDGAGRRRSEAGSSGDKARTCRCRSFLVGLIKAPPERKEETKIGQGTRGGHFRA